MRVQKLQLNWTLPFGKDVITIIIVTAANSKSLYVLQSVVTAAKRLAIDFNSNTKEEYRLALRVHANRVTMLSECHHFHRFRRLFQVTLHSSCLGRTFAWTDLDCLRCLHSRYCCYSGWVGGWHYSSYCSGYLNEWLHCYGCCLLRWYQDCHLGKNLACWINGFAVALWGSSRITTSIATVNGDAVVINVAIVEWVKIVGVIEKGASVSSFIVIVSVIRIRLVAVDFIVIVVGILFNRFRNYHLFQPIRLLVYAAIEFLGVFWTKKEEKKNNWFL